MAKKARPKAWMRATELATRKRVPEGATEAARVFRRELNCERQLQIASELAETRAVELCRAYPNVIDIGAGFRTRRDKGGAPKRRKEVAVVFYVSAKWAGKMAKTTEDAIPGHLYTYVSIKGRHKLCAIPTDVADANDEGGAKVQTGNRQILVQPAPLPHPGTGTLTCLVRRSTLPQHVFAVSCRHVFSLSGRYHGRKFAAWPVIDLLDEASIGKTRNVLGNLRSGPEPSLDAQLCEVGDRPLLRRAFGDLGLAGVVKSPNHLPESAVIVTSHGRLRVRGLRITHRALPYSHPSLGNVVHRSLIQTEFTAAATERGDSGSPLVSLDDRPLLIGMHIAISENGRYSYAIPAAHFLDPRLYERGTASTERWTLVNP